MNRQWTIGNRIYGLSGFLILVIAGISAFAIIRVTSLKAISESISNDSMPGLAHSADIQSTLAEAQIRVLHLLQVSTPEAKKSTRDELAQFASKITEMFDKLDKTIVDAEERQLFNNLKDRRQDYIKTRERFLTVVETNAVEAIKLANGELTTAFSAYAMPLTKFQPHLLTRIPPLAPSRER